MKKVLFIGLGSIGQRHLKNLCAIEDGLEIHALRSTNKVLREDIYSLLTKIVYSFEDVDDSYDMIFITNPTLLHYDTLKQAVKYSKKIFLEKPVFSAWQANVEKLSIPKDCIIYVAAPLRHTSVYKHLKDYIRSENVYSVRAICSSYLPEWRLGTDYRKCYSAQKSMGGDVELELIHEWDYLIDLFGIPEDVKKISGKYSNLEITSNDIALYIARYEDKLISLSVDYFGRYSKRCVEIYTSDDVIEVDFIKQTVRCLKSKKEIVLKETRDEYQINELKYFLDLHQMSDNMNDINGALGILKVANGII